jgi:hypothetical protein
MHSWISAKRYTNIQTALIMASFRGCAHMFWKDVASQCLHNAISVYTCSFHKCSNSTWFKHQMQMFPFNIVKHQMETFSIDICESLYKHSNHANDGAVWCMCLQRFGKIFHWNVSITRLVSTLFRFTNIHI